MPPLDSARDMQSERSKANELRKAQGISRSQAHARGMLVGTPRGSHKNKHQNKRQAARQRERCPPGSDISYSKQAQAERSAAHFAATMKHNLGQLQQRERVAQHTIEHNRLLEEQLGEAHNDGKKKDQMLELYHGILVRETAYCARASSALPSETASASGSAFVAHRARWGLRRGETYTPCELPSEGETRAAGEISRLFEDA